MQKVIAPPADAQQNIISGATEVIVKKKNEDGKVSTIHRGVVVQQTEAFVRVYNPTPKTGDVSPEASEWFPWMSRNCWCEIVGQREGKARLAIPPLLRA